MISPTRLFAVLFLALIALTSSQDASDEPMDVCQAEEEAMETCRDGLGENQTDFTICESCAEFVVLAKV